MNDLKDKIQPAIQKALSLASLATAHRFTVLMMIIGIAVSFALIRTRTFLDIPRNETRYSDERAKINYKSIDEDVLNEFKQAADDQTIEINSQFEPERDNPFSDTE